MSGLIWIQTVWHSDDIHKKFFKKVDFEKNQQTKKSMQNYQVGRVKFGQKLVWKGIDYIFNP